MRAKRPHRMASEGAGGNACASRFRKEALERRRLPGIVLPAISSPESIQHLALGHNVFAKCQMLIAEC